MKSSLTSILSWPSDPSKFSVARHIDMLITLGSNSLFGSKGLSLLSCPSARSLYEHSISPHAVSLSEVRT